LAIQPGMTATAGLPAVAAWDRLLVCPRTRQPLRRCTLAQAERAAGGPLRQALGPAPDAAGPESEVLLRDDRECCYPLVEGVPVLLGPEAWARRGSLPSTALPQYAEDYAEMAVYNRTAQARTDPRHDSHQRTWVRAASQLPPQDRARFPEPAAVWCDQLYEFSAQRAAYQRLAPLAGKRLLQLGGTGIHALKFLLAGAAEAWLATPMLSECVFSHGLARELGLAARFHAVAAVGEELPFPAASFDGIYSSSCLHHMVTAMAAAEARRVLAPGGRFAAIDPWLAPLHRLGTKLVGKREHGVHCRPLDPARLRAFQQAFPGATCERFGALLRYPLLGLQKLGLECSDGWVRRLMECDERLCRAWPVLRRLGSAELVEARQV
jgi:uncharacterized protein YbaR (Trm112 family)/SAM-dependent methyltransferase